MKRMTKFAGMYGDKKEYILSNDYAYVSHRGVKKVNLQAVIDRLGELEDVLERQERQEDFTDKYFKINLWLMERFGEKVYKELGISDINKFEDISKIYQAFDNIYREMNKKYPQKWYELGFSNIKI